MVGAWELAEGTVLGDFSCVGAMGQGGPPGGGGIDVPYSRGPSLQDVMPDDLRWSRCNNNGNKAHNKCHALESS